MSIRTEDRFAASVSLFGAAVWTAAAILAGLHLARVGIIELLFLFAPLVIVPLGLELAHTVERSAGAPRSGLLWVIQSFGAIAVCAALWIPSGPAAAILSSLWLIACVLLGFSRLLNRPRTGYSVLSFAVDVAHVDLILGACWFVVSRAGWRPMGFQEPIILLTAVHFHYSGFATAIIAAATLHTARSRTWHPARLRVLVLLAVLLPFVVAAGFMFSPRLRFAAAAALALAVILLGGVLFRCASEFRGAVARTFLRSAACCAWVAFTLVLLYAIGDYFHQDWITIPGMANSHGVLNALGFVLLGLLGWLTELHAVGSFTEDHRGERPGLYGRAVGQERKPVQPAILPEFVARDFYDR
jgi:YndJ-like protein